MEFYVEEIASIYRIQYCPRIQASTVGLRTYPQQKSGSDPSHVPQYIFFPFIIVFILSKIRVQRTFVFILSNVSYHIPK